MFKRKYSAGKPNIKQKKEVVSFYCHKTRCNNKIDGTHVTMLCKRPRYYPTEDLLKQLLSTSKIKPPISR